jgi:hypothetical protein
VNNYNVLCDETGITVVQYLINGRGISDNGIITSKYEIIVRL